MDRKAVIAASALFLPRPAYAAQQWQQLYDKDVPTIASLASLFGNLMGSLVSLAGVALFIMLVAGGFGFLTAGGDQKKLEKARGTLTGAIMGLVIIVLGYLILLTIKAFTGVDVTTFTIKMD